MAFARDFVRVVFNTLPESIKSHILLKASRNNRFDLMLLIHHDDVLTSYDRTTIT